MKRILGKMKVMREGATLVSVVIATAFLIAIGVVILAASTRYLVSVYTDRNTNENMYSAEGVLAEVRTGLLEYAGDAGVVTYKEIMEDYENYKGRAGSEFGKRFVCRVAGKLQGRSQYTLKSTDIYNDVNADGTKNTAQPSSNMKKRVSLKQLRKLTTIGAPDDSDAEAKKSSPVTSLLNFKVRLGDAVSGAGADGDGVGDPTESEDKTVDSTEDIYFVIHFSPTRGYYLVLKNLVIDFLDAANYRTALQTDIQINAPDYKFEGGKTLDSARDFIVISDKTMEVDGDGDEFKGNIYTGAGIAPTSAPGGGAPSAITEYEDAPGIVINKDDYIDNRHVDFASNKIISRGSMEIYKGARVNVQGEGTLDTINSTASGEVYLKNIKLLSKKINEVEEPSSDDQHTEFRISTNTYIENDLDIRDSNTKVTLGGKYYGYKYSKDNIQETLSNYDSRYSSAILLNGYNNEIKTENLLTLWLAGRAFVERSKTQNEHNDIITGESIAVRSDQIAYMVPDRFMVTEHNPITQSEAESKGLDFDDPTSLVDLDALNEWFDGHDFLCEGTNTEGNPPVTGDYKLSTESGGEGYVFVFLNFKNEKKANEFFDWFYNDSNRNANAADVGDITANDLNDRARPYISSKATGVKIDPSLYTLAAMILKDYNGGGTIKSDNFFAGETPNASLLMQGNGFALRYMNYITKLNAGDNVTNAANTRFEQLTADDQAPMVSGKMFDFSVALDSIPTDGPGAKSDAKTGAKVYCGTGALNNVSDSYGGRMAGEDSSIKPKTLIINKGDVNIDSSTKLAGLIIADGNVTVKGNCQFDGLIIATGDVILKSNVKMTSNLPLVEKLFEFIQSDENLCRIVRGLDNRLTDNNKDLEKCIRYLDWKKNTY